MESQNLANAQSTSGVSSPEPVTILRRCKHGAFALNESCPLCAPSRVADSTRAVSHGQCKQCGKPLRSQKTKPPAFCPGPNCRVAHFRAKQQERLVDQTFDEVWNAEGGCLRVVSLQVKTAKRKRKAPPVPQPTVTPSPIVQGGRPVSFTKGKPLRVRSAYSRAERERMRAEWQLKQFANSRACNPSVGGTR
jgi:hypothetical protein